MRIILGLVFSVSLLLLIPLGYQAAFAGFSSFGPIGDPQEPPIGIAQLGPVGNNEGAYFFENPIGFDPNGSPQEKHFLSPIQNQNLIREQVTILGSHPVYDWHEEIDPLDAFWVDPFGTVLLECDGVTPLSNAYVINTLSNPQTIWIDFIDPIMPGQCFHIEKIFQPNTQAQFVRIIEYPTGNELDFGDLPQPPHPTTLAMDGARHVITGAHMGGLIDGETDGQPTVGATGDDAAGVDDEDGFFSGGLEAGTMDSVTVFTNSLGGEIHIFMAQGGALTHVGSKTVAVIIGPNTVPVDLTGFSAGPADIRVRYCTTSDCSSPTGLSLSGEVEDYIETLTADDPPPPNPVGGTGIPISTTSLVLAGMQSNFSILMALTAVGFGAFAVLYYSTKKKTEKSSD